MWRVYRRGNRQQTAGDRKSSELFCSGELKKSDACYTQWPARDILNNCIFHLHRCTAEAYFSLISTEVYYFYIQSYLKVINKKKKQQDKNTLDIQERSPLADSMLSEILIRYTEVGYVFIFFFFLFHDSTRLSFRISIISVKAGNKS